MRVISLNPNEDEMLVLTTNKIDDTDFPPELKKEIKSFVRMIHCMMMGTLLSGELFPVLWENINDCVKKNHDILLEWKEKQ